MSMNKTEEDAAVGSQGETTSSHRGRKRETWMWPFKGQSTPGPGGGGGRHKVYVICIITIQNIIFLNDLTYLGWTIFKTEHYWSLGRSQIGAVAEG